MNIVDAKRQENVILGVYRGEADAGFCEESALVVWKDAVDMKKDTGTGEDGAAPELALCLVPEYRSVLVKAVTSFDGTSRPGRTEGGQDQGLPGGDEAEFEALRRY